MTPLARATKFRRKILFGAMAAALLLTPLFPPAAAARSAAAATSPSSAAAPPPSCGPIGPYPHTGAYQHYGEYGGSHYDAASMGWAGDGADGVVACLGGSFYPLGGTDGINSATYGFGIYQNGPTTWSNSGGYLPAFVTRFTRDGFPVSITNFADRAVISGHAYLVVYSRVVITNPHNRGGVMPSPDPSSGLTALNNAPAAANGATYDYAVAVGRFGGSYGWPTGSALRDAGGFDQHYEHMQSFWQQQLAGIAQITGLPDPRLIDAYRTGYIYTQISRDGTHLNDGVNGYRGEFSHNVIGILSTLLKQGDFSGAQQLLLRMRSVIGVQPQYVDGVWKYSWPWAQYLMETGDVSFVKAYFATEGPQGSESPSIKDTAHQIAADRTGPGGIMKMTNDIDANGYWTIDNYGALFGLLTYRYIAQRIGDKGEAAWATGEYDSLLTAVDKTLGNTISTYHLDYLPCSMTEPNTDNRCANPEDANWAAPFAYGFGGWAWPGALFGAGITASDVSHIDGTYKYGFGRLKGLLPPNTMGGFANPASAPPYNLWFYSTSYNAGYGSWGLAGSQYRDQGILNYEFMITNDQSGPYSWWESSGSPSSTNPWSGTHPVAANGSCPVPWGMSMSNAVLLDSIAAQDSDGSLIVGRGIPDKWIAGGADIAVQKLPTTDGHRIGVQIAAQGLAVKVTLSGQPAGPVLLQLPAFLNGNIAQASAGDINNSTGTVELSPSVHSVTVTLRHQPTGT